ncbi:RapZ C-terminal domain-containing protein [Actinacidiphila sp. ITFR-21]|uniref:RapZ C-terminal domain-containing protein n=1 Tax=Actinacidiphila sp. ITFR-21 TaxID=3075199 RepID=UPI00288C3737|nr:RNase adapter RapZ [Streptomyces sp. ITFR-21]WNI19916.1 RNase adapter RapZ [Streptomyces sp. ITFR-21]
MNDQHRSALAKLANLQRRADVLLVKTRTRAVYDELVTAKDTAAEYNLEGEYAEATRELAKFTEEPPKVTDEEVFAHHQFKAETLRGLIDELGAEGDVFREALAEAEAELADLTRGADVRLVSFGYLHHGDGLPEDLRPEIVLDLRRHFRDPHVHPELVQMNGLDLPVHRLVMGTDGIAELLDATAAAVRAFRSGPSAGPVTVAVGCAGGRHRSVAFATSLRSWLDKEMSVTVEHLDVQRDVIDRSTEPEAVPEQH